MEAFSAQTITIASRQREIPEAGFLSETLIRADRLEIAFVPPVDWRPGGDPTNLVWSWTTRDMTAMLNLSVRFNVKQPPEPPNVEARRAALLNRYPESRVIEQFRCYSAGGQGWTFDLEQPAGTNLKRAIRVAHVHFQGGTVEFTLATSKEAFPQFRHAMTSLMNSFQVVEVSTKPQSGLAKK